MLRRREVGKNCPSEASLGGGDSRGNLGASGAPGFLEAQGVPKRALIGPLSSQIAPTVPAPK